MSFMAVAHLFFGWFGLGIGLAVLCVAAYVATFFVPNIPLVTTEMLPHLRAVLLTVAAVSAAATYVYGKAYADGYGYAVNQIAAKNQEALRHVKQAVGNVQNCVDSGGTWDTVSGVCGH